MSDKELQKEILALENDVKQLEATINVIKKRITHLKDIAWDKQSKKESSQMYKVLKEDKTHTRVKSNVGDIKVDKDFMEKEIKKHLDNPNLRGMVTTQEMLSFPKVAKGVEAEYDERYQGYSWKTKANDGSILNYGERDFGKGHRLLTAHSKTERGERGQLRQEFNDRDFHNSVESIIPQQNQSVNDFKAKLEEFSTKKTNAIKSINKEFKR
ncbi:hypothetical protein B6662_04535 [Campylobacter jejuni]|uniref:Cpp33 n=5 Tax=Campylobacter TaxID=194 RepID=A0A5T0KYJ0_CAMJU|nr:MULTISPECIES: hypothetical protein [Campylobacter]EAH4590513.1 hypothetical protein [Campylobacter jejuni]EAK3302569.1 hypothetical protein [Campylobacter hyointestinalis]ADT73532.1 cpp33 [Campylobacter jejuni subsp. jejuni S3]APA55103.1 hypothetical protein BLD37_08945 [Campylobacter coli]EAC1916931.1 hypothetical protein [Campylobacter coli]